jgi:hypothetical protein
MSKVGTAGMALCGLLDMCNVGCVRRCARLTRVVRSANDMNTEVDGYTESTTPATKSGPKPLEDRTR